MSNTIKKIFGLRTDPRASVVSSRLERALFLAFLFAAPFQARIALFPLREGAGEGGYAWLWVSDALFILLVALWIRREGFSRRAFSPLFGALVALPALVANFDALALWSTLEIVKGFLLFTYARSHRGWLLSSSRWLYVFFISLSVNAGAALLQFFLQRDIGSALGLRELFKLFGESEVSAQMPGVAKFMVQGALIMRGYGFTPHPNILAALLLVGVAIVAFLYILRGIRWLPRYSWSRQKEELVRGGLLFLLLLGILLTFSRSAMLIALLFPGLLALFVFGLPLLRRAFGWEAARFVILFGAISAIIATAFLPFLAERDLPQAYEQSVVLREFYGQQALEMIGTHPWAGVGPGHFVSALDEANPTLPSWQLQPVHNVLLLLTAELGIPAAVFLLAGFLFLILSAWRRILREHDPGIALASVCFFITATMLLLFSTTDHFLWTSQQGRVLLWFVLGLLV